MKIKNIDHTEVDIFISRKVSEFKALGGTGGRANNILAMMSSIKVKSLFWDCEAEN